MAAFAGNDAFHPNPLPSPERVEDGTHGHKDGFARLHPLEHRVDVFPILKALLHVVDKARFAFIDFVQDETGVAGRGRIHVHRVRKLRGL